MRKEKVNTFKLGLFVTVTVLLFVIAVYLIGNEQNLFRKTFRLHAVFHNVAGLKPGNTVRYSGIDIGVVEEISLLSDSTLVVEMVLQKKMQSYIRKNAVAAIGSDGLVGNKILNISPGSGDGAEMTVNELDTIRTYQRPATDDMLETLKKTNENIALFSQQLLQISDKANRGEGMVNLLLEDEAMADDMKHTAKNLRYSSESLRHMGANMQALLTAMEHGNGLLHELLYDTLIIADLRAVSGKLNQVATHELGPLLQNMYQSADDIARASATAREVLQEIETGEGTLGMLIRDPATEQEVRQTLNDINQSVQLFNENMEAMRHNFLFRKYFKKLEKGKLGQ